MTPEDEKFERIAQRHIADLKKSSKVITEDAAVRAVHKVMAEFSQGANTEAKVEYHTTMIQCPHCDGSVRVQAQPHPDNFIHALMYDVARRDSEAQQQAPMACLVETEQGVMVWPIADINEAGTYCEENEFPILLYASPQPSKPWVGLTEYDIDQIPYSCSHADSRLIAFAIEAKLKERNT